MSLTETVTSTYKMTRVQANIYFFDISSSLLSHYLIYQFFHRFSKRLLELWLSQGSTLTLPSLVNPSREVCKLKYLTGAAPVVYGVPDILTGGGWPQLELQIKQRRGSRGAYLMTSCCFVWGHWKSKLMLKSVVSTVDILSTLLTALPLVIKHSHDLLNIVPVKRVVMTLPELLDCIFI